MSDTLNILQIAPRIPWPLAEGGAVGIYNISRFLSARGHRITFVTFGEDGRRKTGDERRKTGDERRETRDGRRETRDERRKTGDERRETKDGRRNVSRLSSIDPTDPTDRSPFGGLDDFTNLVIVPHSTKNSVFGALRNLLERTPYTMSKYLSPAMFAQLDALCAERRFDVMHVDHVHMAAYGRYVRERWGIPYLLREHNFETTIHRRFAEQARLPLAGAYLRMQSARLYRYEVEALRHPDVVAAITEEDAEAMWGAVPRDVTPSAGSGPSAANDIDTGVLKGRNISARGEAPGRGAAPTTPPVQHSSPNKSPSRWLGATGNDGVGKPERRPHITVIPAGVDVEAIAPVGRPREEKHVVLAGPMHWAPNADAVLWFLTDIWPRIARAVPEARCTVAGAHPTKRILRMATDRIAVPGFVEDFRALLASATVMAVPLRVGGGMRIKLLEYFAHGKAVVSTSVGAEGNEARDGEELMLADGADAFADAVVRLLKNPDLAVEIGRRSRALAERRYSWNSVAAAFESAYGDAIARAHPAPSADHRYPAGGDAQPTEEDAAPASRTDTHPPETNAGDARHPDIQSPNTETGDAAHPDIHPPNTETGDAAHPDIQSRSDNEKHED